MKELNSLTEEQLRVYDTADLLTLISLHTTVRLLAEASKQMNIPVPEEWRNVLASTDIAKAVAELNARIPPRLP